jgi:hypothetical protein
VIWIRARGIVLSARMISIFISILKGIEVSGWIGRYQVLLFPCDLLNIRRKLYQTIIGFVMPANHVSDIIRITAAAKPCYCGLQNFIFFNYNI